MKHIKLGEILEEIRWDKRSSKKDFSILIGVSQPFYSEIIHHKKSLNFTTLEKICFKLDLSVCEFLNYIT